jgi:eukaryotic-like serine/threonine-protein kinase
MKTIQTIGRYRVDGLLGTGAMGEVYRAYDPVIDRPVAIKVVRPELIAGAASDQWLQRFRREARAAGRRFHPNIVAILDFGENDGAPFLAMEYVEGRSLDAVLKTSGPLKPAPSVAIITQVLSALGFAHENGIVHRDVKPSNIMVLNDGNIKVADFGIARIDASEFTIVGDLLGTPAYMSPEQLSGAPVDKRSDLFAAGVIFFEMLTGVKPFRGKSLTEIMSNMEKRGPEDIRALNPAVPDALKRVITKALAFDPASRYGDAAEFSQAITAALPARFAQSSTAETSASQAFEPEAGVPLIARTAQTSGGGTTLHPDLLREIERDLATFIGPVASIAVRRALRETNDLVALYELLGKQVESPRDRAELLTKGRQRAAAAPAPLHASPPPPSKDAVQKPDQPAMLPDPANIITIESSLTRYIGPIAKILIKRELDKFETLDKFYLVLAAHIPDERDRNAFLNARGAN